MEKPVENVENYVFSTGNSFFSTGKRVVGFCKKRKKEFAFFALCYQWNPVQILRNNAEKLEVLPNKAVYSRVLEEVGR